MLISPFTPLFWGTDHKTDGIESRYMQTFSTTDRILLEFICTSNESAPVVAIITQDSRGLPNLTLNTWAMPGYKLHFGTLQGLSPGVYRLYLPNYSIWSKYFRITDDEQELAQTSLIQYSMLDNRDRKDVVSLIDGMRHFFDFRVPGGFKDNGWTFGVVTEQFTTPEADIVSLYAQESTQKKLTVGGQMGVPIWFGELLNRACCCHFLYIDGERYARKETSTPEVTQQQEGVNSFVLVQQLQKVVNLDPQIETTNQMLLRRVGVDTDDFRTLELNSTTYNRLIQ